jgi:hypothetical protein
MEGAMDTLPISEDGKQKSVENHSVASVNAI